MPNNATVSMTAEQLQEMLQKVMTSGIAAAKSMNPLEEDEYEKQTERKLRRELASIENAKIEHEAQERKKRGCCHHVDKEGNMCHPKNGGKPVTQGQVHSEGLLTLMCLRCTTTWTWQGTQEEISEALQNGMKRWPVPSEERVAAYHKIVDDRDMMLAKSAKERIDALRAKLTKSA